MPYAAARMYALVDDIEAYPKFLPWCPRAEVLAAAGREKTARLTLARGGLRTSFTTRNALEPGRRIDMRLLDGPFRRLHGVWTFADIPHGSRVALDMEFEVKGSLRLIALPAVFAEICNRLVNAFVAEAHRQARRELGR